MQPGQHRLAGSPTRPEVTRRRLLLSADLDVTRRLLSPDCDVLSAHKSLQADRYLGSFFHDGTSWTVNIKNFKIVNGDETISKTQVKFWYDRFKDGRQSIEDDSRSGCPSTWTTKRNIQQVSDLIYAERKITIQTIT
ncbi:GVQW3 [Cordylochernes scorpioides]|uniref:GVQW3 n=1 Tax=Cordylochernes scorpioides TaxID=51811 RepID=A0ABY6LNN1_9ARAC|nr:GVQW3 [Cordylochernes scorpioides]